MRKGFLGVLSFALVLTALTSLAQPVSGPLVSTNRGVPIFSQTNGKKIDPSPVYIDATGNLYFGGPGTVIVNDMTTAERNLLTATNGMVIYNTTDAKLQVRENGAWVDIGSGTGVFMSNFDQDWFRTNGAIVRPALGKTFPSWINVTDTNYGAIGNGIVDDTAAIQAAINEAQTNSKPPVVYLPGLHRITATLTITNSGVTLIGDGPLKSTIRVTTSGIGRAVYVHNSAARLFNVNIRGLRVEGTNGLASPPNGIEFVNASECSVEDFYGTKLNNGIVIDGCEIMFARHFNLSQNNVGIYQTRQNANGFGYANVWASGFTMYQNTNASVKIDSAVSKSSYRDGWIEATTNGFQLLNRATTDAALDGISIQDVQMQNVTGQGFDGGRFLSATASGVTNYFYVQNLSIENCKVITPGASNAVEFIKGANTNANTAFHDISIRRSFFNGMSVGAIYSDTASLDGEMSQLWVGVLPELTGQGTWFQEIHPGALLMRDTNNLAESVMARTGGNDIQYYSFRTNSGLGFFVFDSGRSAYWDIGNNGNDMSLAANVLTVSGGIIATNYVLGVDGRFTNSVSFGPNVDNTFYETGGLALWQVAGKPFFFYDALRGNTTLSLNADRSSSFFGSISVNSNITADTVIASNRLTLNANDIWGLSPGANVTFSTNTGTKVLTINSSGSGGGGSGSGSLQNATVTGSGTDYTITDTYARVDFGAGDPTHTLPAAGTYLLVAHIVEDSANAFVKRFKFRDTTAGADVAGSEIFADYSGGGHPAEMAIHAVYTSPGANTVQLWAQMDDPAYSGVHVVWSTNTTFSYVRIDGVLGFSVNAASVSTPNFQNTAATGTVPSSTIGVTGTNFSLTIGPATLTEAGVVTSGTQRFGGTKTFDNINVTNAVNASSGKFTNNVDIDGILSVGALASVESEINGKALVSHVHSQSILTAGTNSALMSGNYKDAFTRKSQVGTLSGATPTVDWQTEPLKFHIVSAPITYGEANRPTSSTAGESLEIHMTNSTGSDQPIVLPSGWRDETGVGFTNLVAGKTATIYSKWNSAEVKFYWRTYEP